MRRLRPPAGVLLPILLIGLVAVLATLQYRWLGKVSEAEREQMSRSLAQRAREFADEFDAEIGRVYRACQITDDAVSRRNWSALAAALDRWRAASRFPGLIRALYLAEAHPGGYALRRFDPDRQEFDDRPLTPWPVHLEPIRQQVSAGSDPAPSAVATAPVPRVAATSPPTATFVASAIGPIHVEIPALVVPVTSALSAPAAEPTGGSVATAGRHAEFQQARAFAWLPPQRTFVVADLDGALIRTTVLPALVDRHFPARRADDFHVAVIAPSGSTLYTRGLAASETIDPDRADSVTPFFGLRLDPSNDVLGALGVNTIRMRPPAPGGPAPGGSEAPTGGGTAERRMSMSVYFEGQVRLPAVSPPQPAGVAAALVRVQRPGWRLVLRHGAGSLDAAVSQVRRRNLALSFGILTVLAAGVTLVVTNARRSQQLAARQMHFVAAVSHELRTPLAVIRSAAQNLAAGVVTNAERARRYGTLIDDEGRRLTDMVEQVLDYAGIDGARHARECRPVDLAAVADQVVATSEATGDVSDVVVELDIDNDGRPIPAVAGDPDALRRAVQNLVANAVKHGSDGRWVGVAVRAEPPDEPREVVVEVRDRGRGIEPADLNQIFEPFYRGRHAVEQQVRGNGLGLSLVKRIVETHGGRVTALSPPGEGAVFALRLPVALPRTPDDAGVPPRDAPDIAA